MAGMESIKLYVAALSSLVTLYLKLHKSWPAVGVKKSKQHAMLDFITGFLAFDVSKKK